MVYSWSHPSYHPPQFRWPVCLVSEESTTTSAKLVWTLKSSVVQLTPQWWTNCPQRSPNATGVLRTAQSRPWAWYVLIKIIGPQWPSMTRNMLIRTQSVGDLGGRHRWSRRCTIMWRPRLLVDTALCSVCSDRRDRRLPWLLLGNGTGSWDPQETIGKMDRQFWGRKPWFFSQ